jgi:hypothetical protein
MNYLIKYIYTICTQGEHANHYSTDEVDIIKCL